MPYRPDPRIPVLKLADGTEIPRLGLGTWTLGERRNDRAREVAVVREALDLGVTLIDTAEMYGEGGAEEVVGEAIAGRRDRVFIVSKVYPHNAGAKSAIAACERSLERLKTDRLDLYLLHWRGRIPLAETIGAFSKLKRDGKIARWGVSNLGLKDMRELAAIAGGDACATNQVLYHLDERGIEWDLAPWMRERAMPVMAYSPFGHGALLRNRRLAAIARELSATPAQLALAWVLKQPLVFTVPMTRDAAHLRANVGALGLELDQAALAALDAAFPAPSGPSPLAML